jgi:tetratricopeptide (TPR) repeat protein
MRKGIGVRLLLAGCSVFLLSTLRAQDAKFAADNLKYSRDFYSKVHFVAIAESPQPFKYDRYPSGGPERIQCDDGTYTRQHAKPWVHSNDKMRTGLPIDYAERNRYVMTFALREDWGRTGEPVDKETARKLDGWIKLAEAALNITPANAKLLDKSETTDGRAQWVFETPSENPNGVPGRFTFRRPLSDKDEKVLLHEFSGSLRLEGDKVASGGAADRVRFGFGYMMRGPEGSEVSERVWEEMQQAREKKGASGEQEPESPASAGTVEDFFNRAGAKKAAGDLDGAIADYDRAIQIDPKDAAIYNNRGLAKQAKGDLDAAIVDFNRAIQLNPKDAIAYSNRGNTKRDKGDLDGAILDYNRAIRLDRKYAYAYYDRGLAKKQKSDLDGAIVDYNRVIELDPKFAKAYCDRGVAKRRKGDLDGAISDYDRTVELDPKYAIAYFNRGNAKDDKGDLEGAIADYNRGIELNPKDSKAYDYRAEVHAKKKEYDAAVSDTLTAIELDPKNGDYYLSLSWYQLFNRKPREAIAASLKALELSPEDAVMIKTNLAHGYLFDNHFDKAKTIYLENRNAKLRDGKRTFSQAALDDFKEFQDAGVTHPDMEKIKALLTSKTEAR